MSEPGDEELERDEEAVDGRRLAARPGRVQRRRAAARDHPAAGHRRGADARLDGPRGDATHPHRGPRHVLVAIAPGVLAQGRHLRPRAVRARRGARLRRRHPARDGRAGRASPATRARAPASTATRSRSSIRACRDPPNDDEETACPPPPASRSSPPCSPGAASCPSCASSSPTARRRSASTASSPPVGPARSCSNPPSRAASGRATRSSASRRSACSRSATAASSGSTTGSSAERALGDDAPLAPLAALEALYERWQHRRRAGRAARSPAGSSASSAGRRSGRSSTCPTARPPTSRCRVRRSRFVSELVVIDHRTGTVQLVASVLNDGDDDAEALWVDAQERLDGMQHAARAAVRGVARRDRPRRAAPRRRHRTEKADFLAAVERSKRVHPRRRHLPGRHLAALRAGGHGRSDRRLPGAAQPQPEPVHVPAPPRRPRRASRTGSSAPRPRRS